MLSRFSSAASRSLTDFISSACLTFAGKFSPNAFGSVSFSILSESSAASSLSAYICCIARIFSCASESFSSASVFLPFFSSFSPSP